MDPNAGKKHLINRLNRAQLQAKLDAETFKRVTVSFYRYVSIEDPFAFRDSLFHMWSALDCLGRIYVAKEGINAQMNVPEHHWEAFKSQLYQVPQLDKIPFKVAVEDDGKSFLKLTVKVRKMIVADGLQPGDYDVSNVGRHLTAKEWNEALENQEVVVVDMRNHYESEVGHFDKAVLPEAETFREELPEVLSKLKGHEDKKVLLYCTGGIRCEKASSFLKHHGFQDVNQLHGGIIDYYRQIQHEGLPNKFKGKNFVFDERLGERISEEVIASCHQCDETCDKHVNCANVDCNILFIQCDACAEKYEGCCSKACSDYLKLPEAEKVKIRANRKQKKIFHRYKKQQRDKMIEKTG
jgi:UPF0176 protein